MKRASSLPKPHGRSAGDGSRGRGRVAAICRTFGWNAAWLIAILALIAAAGELWRRVTVPFFGSHLPLHFVPDVGMMPKPDAQVRETNNMDFWTISRTNRLGFLDREPPSAERAADSCHVAIIGDSFVMAQEVPIADKVQVRLENLAARRIQQLDVTTSAYGFGGTGQINQLPYYDEYARRLRPKLVILVFVPNDYGDNFTILRALIRGFHPDRYPHLSGKRNRHGVIELRPPSADARRYRPLPRWKWKGPWVSPLRHLGVSQDSLYEDLWQRSLHKAAGVSYFLHWLGKLGLRYPVPRSRYARAVLMAHPDIYRHWLDDWSWLHDRDSGNWARVDDLFARRELPRTIERALDYTAFGLDRFKERADRDGFRLAILSVHLMGTKGNPLFDRMAAMAEARGIPVVDQHDWIVRQGERVEDAHWAHDRHWNATGHRQAAEALLAYIERNQDVCRPGGEAANGGG